METEWQHYLSQCIETIVLIAEGRPIQVFEQVVSCFASKHIVQVSQWYKFPNNLLN